MAFENLFGNIDFQAQNKMAMAQQQQFQEMLGRGVAAAQNARKLDIQERQMEAKRNEFDYKKVAQQKIIERLMVEKGMTQEQAAMALYGAQQAGAPVYGEMGEVIGTKGNPLDQLGLGMPTGTGSIPRGAITEFPVGQKVGNTTTGSYSSEFPEDFGQYDRPMAQMTGDSLPIPPMGDGENYAEILASGGFNPDPYAPAGGSPIVGVDEFNARGEALPVAPQIADQGDMATQTGRKELVKAQAGIEGEYAKLSAEEQFQIRKEQREKKKNLPKEVLAIESSFQEAENVNETLREIYDKAGALTTGWLGDKSKDIAGTPAHDVAALMKTVESDAGLSKLIEVKERGGTFGALQEKELELLVASRAALMQSQSPEQFKEQLYKYQQQRMKTMNLMGDFFESKYGYVPEGLTDGLDKNIIDPKIDAAKSGKIFTNAAGEKIKLVNGQWQKI